MIYLLTFIFSAIITAVSITLILSPHYHDGAIGRLGLAFMAVGTGLGIVFRDISEYLDGTSNFHYVSPAGLTILAGLALFLVRHAFRFWKFCRECDKQQSRNQPVRGKGESKFDRRART